MEVKLTAYCTVLGKRPSPSKCPEFDSIVVLEVLCVTTHCAKLFVKWIESRSTELTYITAIIHHSDALQVPQHLAAKFHTHQSVASAHLQHFSIAT